MGSADGAEERFLDPGAEVDGEGVSVGRDREVGRDSVGVLGNDSADA